MVRSGLIAGLAVLSLAACDRKQSAVPDSGSANAAAEQPPDSGLMKMLDEAQGLGETARLIRAAGLDRALDSKGSYTLFAPTDAAIAALPPDQTRLLASPDGRPQLIALLRQHIAPGYVARSDLDDGLARAKGSVTLASFGPAPIVLHRHGDAIQLGDGADAPHLAGPPIVARNGIIYPIDGVLPPPGAR